MRETLERLDRDFDEALSGAGVDSQAIETVRVRFLGRKGLKPHLVPNGENVLARTATGLLGAAQKATDSLTVRLDDTPPGDQFHHAAQTD